MKSSIWVILAFLAIHGLPSFLSAAEEQCGRQNNKALCPHHHCCSDNGFCGDTEAYCGQGCQSQCEGPGPYDVSTFLSEQTFNEMFLRRSECKTKDFYTYDAFVTAARSFPAFGTAGDVDVMKREIAAFLAQTAFQTAGVRRNDVNAVQWGYCYKKFGTSQSDSSYCVSNKRYPCVEGEKYYPRGAMQISYNYNYGQTGDNIGEDLLENPDMVETDPVISFKTALAYWMMSHQPNMPSCHEAMTADWKNAASNEKPGYGLVTKIIHGKCEDQSKDELRVQFYKQFCDKLGVTYGEKNLYCVATKAARVGKCASI